MIPVARGPQILRDPILNKGTAFTEPERVALGLHGLLPAGISTMEDQIQRVMANYRSKKTPLERYIHLSALQDRNETLFYRVLLDNLEELMPIIYTPTVGEACQKFGQIFRRPRGLYLSRYERGGIREILRNWPNPDVRVIVVSDGEHILGLGDLGASGMGIPVGKLALYTACAGVAPSQTLPVLIDAGTNNEELLEDPLYLGVRERRLRGPAYDELVDEFVTAVQAIFPRALIQFEDFGTDNAFHLLARYREKILTFDDDVQGTAAVALAGLLASLRLSGRKLEEEKVLFLGAGEAGIGIAALFVNALVEAGVPEAEARRRAWFVDSKGLVVAGRPGLSKHKQPWAHEHAAAPDLLAAIEALRPTALIGVSGAGKTFSQPVLEAMARINERPVIFALSSPAGASECTAEEAYGWTQGRAIFASGTPCAPVTSGGKRSVPGQANNAYVFPGVGLGVSACQARLVSDEMFSAAARTLASLTGETDLGLGRVYPALSRIREVSLAIAVAVAEVAWKRGLALRERPPDVRALIEGEMYQPVYPCYA